MLIRYTVVIHTPDYQKMGEILVNGYSLAPNPKVARKDAQKQARTFVKNLTYTLVEQKK